MKAVLRQAPYSSRSDLRSALEEYSTSLPLGNRSFGRFICDLVLVASTRLLGLGAVGALYPFSALFGDSYWLWKGKTKGRLRVRSKNATWIIEIFTFAVT